MTHPFLKNLYVSVDGTDCRVMEQSPFNTGWYSHKFNGPGLRYEVAVGIYSGNIVWVNGPFPCGNYPDVKIFKETMVSKLNIDELVIADRGYKHAKCVYSLAGFESLSSSLRARHEVVNRRLKHFSVLRTVFRHDLSVHSMCFHAVANITQLMIKHEDPMFKVYNIDNINF